MGDVFVRTILPFVLLLAIFWSAT